MAKICERPGCTNLVPAGKMCRGCGSSAHFCSKECRLKAKAQYDHDRRVRDELEQYRREHTNRATCIHLGDEYPPERW